MDNLLCKQCDNFTSGLIDGLCETCYNKPENAYRDIECLNCNIIFIINFDTLFCAFCRDKSEVIENIRTEYIKLKAIEQAAKDFTINLNALLPVNNNGIENHFCNSVLCLSCPSTYQDFKQLKELLQID